MEAKEAEEEEGELEEAEEEEEEEEIERRTSKGKSKRICLGPVVLKNVHPASLSCGNMPHRKAARREPKILKYESIKHWSFQQQRRHTHKIYIISVCRMRIKLLASMHPPCRKKIREPSCCGSMRNSPYATQQQYRHVFFLCFSRKRNF